MKKITFIIVSALFTINSSAQKIATDNVPSAVVSSFKAKFSIAEKTAWEIDYDNFKADFSVGKSEFSAKFDKDGKWLETDTYLKPSDLPKVIKETISKKYGELSSYKMQEVVKVENEKEIIFEIEVKKGENIDELGINEKGEIVKEDGKEDGKID